MYTKVSIPKNPRGAAAAPKDSAVILIAAEDIVSEPSRTVGNPVLSGNITLAEGAKGVSIYGTNTTIQTTEEVSGDPDGRGIKQGVVYDHPGDSDEIRAHKEAFLNTPVVALVKTCEGGSSRVTMVGSKCNPLYLNFERTDSNEASKTTFTWKQEIASPFGLGVYEGSIPDLAGEAGSDSPAEEGV